jgi:hypothetical protein
MHSGTMVKSNRIILAALGMVVTFCALCIAAWVIGPSVRRLFGDPFDYNSDYTSPEAWLQSLIVVSSSVMVAFVPVGLWLRSGHRTTTATDAFVVANPVTFVMAFYFYQRLFAQACSEGILSYEYISIKMGGVQALLTLVAYAPAIWIITRIRR